MSYGIIDKSKLKTLADTIRSVTGTTDTLTLDQMNNAIATLTPNLPTLYAPIVSQSTNIVTYSHNTKNGDFGNVRATIDSIEYTSPVTITEDMHGKHIIVEEYQDYFNSGYTDIRMIYTPTKAGNIYIDVSECFAPFIYVSFSVSFNNSTTDTIETDNNVTAFGETKIFNTTAGASFNKLYTNNKSKLKIDINNIIINSVIPTNAYIWVTLNIHPRYFENLSINPYGITFANTIYNTYIAASDDSEEDTKFIEGKINGTTGSFSIYNYNLTTYKYNYGDNIIFKINDILTDKTDTYYIDIRNITLPKYLYILTKYYFSSSTSYLNNYKYARNSYHYYIYKGIEYYDTIRYPDDIESTNIADINTRWFLTPIDIRDNNIYATVTPALCVFNRNKITSNHPEYPGYLKSASIIVGSNIKYDTGYYEFGENLDDVNFIYYTLSGASAYMTTYQESDVTIATVSGIARTSISNTATISTSYAYTSSKENISTSGTSITLPKNYTLFCTYYTVDYHTILKDDDIE